MSVHLRLSMHSSSFNSNIPTSFLYSFLILKKINIDYCDYCNKYLRQIIYHATLLKTIEEDCNRMVSMVVHFGRCLVEKFNFGLCRLNSDTLENLETHLKDVKLHIEEEHVKEENLFHLKMNRIVRKNVDCNIP